jgi:hypothetical protein
VNAKVATNLAREKAIDFGVARDSGSLSIRRISPPRMIAAFPDQPAAVGREMPKQFPSFQTRIASSS